MLVQVHPAIVQMCVQASSDEQAAIQILPLQNSILERNLLGQGDTLLFAFVPIPRMILSSIENRTTRELLDTGTLPIGLNVSPFG